MRPRVSGDAAGGGAWIDQEGRALSGAKALATLPNKRK